MAPSIDQPLPGGRIPALPLAPPVVPVMAVDALESARARAQLAFDAALHALGDHLAGEFGVETVFLDAPTGY